VRDLLAALNTGHAGGCGTLHANAAGELPARLEALGSLAGLRSAAVHAQAAAALDAVVHVRRRAGAGRQVRRVVEIATVERDGSSGLTVRTALRLVDVERLPRHGEPGSSAPRRERTTVGPGWPALAERLSLSADFPPDGTEPESVAAPESA
jgi:pilus assembly protein CpaF